MNGVININKPLGITSHDVVYRLRKILSVKKIGHTGTLDPDASGVLPMCVGRATKTADMLTAKDKQYIAELTLGSRTDTLDKTGTVLERAEVNASEADIKAAVNKFIGDIEQIPPMFSAIKINGKKLYELARKGEEIERKPRCVRIGNIEILDINLPEKKVSILVDCSKGTYIRSLCDDIGKELGCFAHMSNLIRTKSGRFDIKESYTLEQVEEMFKSGDLSFITSIDKVFEEFESITIPEKLAKKMCNGTQVRFDGTVEGKTYRVYDKDGNFLTVSKVENGLLKILKTFYQTMEG